MGSNAKNILSSPASVLVVPATVLAEAVWIVSRGKTSIPHTDALLTAVKTDSRVIIYPLNMVIVEQTISLSAITEMHDRQIVATVLVLANLGEAVGLLTCDQNITASGLVSIIW